MPNFSAASSDKLSTCHPDLIALFTEVVSRRDCSILEGHRTKERQDELFLKGASMVVWPNSNHNARPSLAVDVAPYIPGKGLVFDIRTCAAFAGYVLAVADRLYDSGCVTHRVRWGGDWNGNHDCHDQKFNDLVHFELRPEE